MKDVRIYSVMLWPTTNQYVLVFEEIEGSRLLLIWIGGYEAEMIALPFQKKVLPRPLPHDLINNIVKKMKLKVSKIEIRDIKDDIYYANIVLGQNSNTIEIDARPSDAVAVAVRSKCPIYVSEKVLDKGATVSKPIDESEVEGFKKDLKNMKPEDFFKRFGKEDK